jgi:hypothetical protein
MVRVKVRGGRRVWFDDGRSYGAGEEFEVDEAQAAEMLRTKAVALVAPIQTKRRFANPS